MLKGKLVFGVCESLRRSWNPAGTVQEKLDVMRV